MVFSLEVDDNHGQTHILRCGERQRNEVIDWARSLYTKGLIDLSRVTDAVLMFDMTVDTARSLQ